MSRKFISVIVAASIAVTALTAPQAQAGNRELNRFLAGVAAIAIIGAIANEKSSSQARQPAYIPPTPRRDYEQRRDDNLRRQNEFHSYPIAPPTPRPLPRHVSRKSLPSVCVKNVQANGHRRNVLMLNCLKRNFSYTASLPNTCSTNVARNDGTRFVRPAYGLRCLQNHGYSVAYN